MIDRRIGKIRIRRGTDAQRKSVIFPEGELVYSIDKKKIYVGNDTQYGGILISNKNYVVDVLGSPQIPVDANHGSIIHEITTKKTYVVGYDTDKTTLKLFTMFDLNGSEIQINIDNLKQRLSAVEECLKTKPPEPPKNILTWVTQPSDIYIDEHQTATFTASATYTSPVTYAWFRIDTNSIHSGSTTNNTLIISDAQLTDGVAYYCVASSTGVASITSNIATLHVTSSPVLVAPSIVTHPKSQTVNPLVPVTFTIEAVGSAPLTYQWMIDGVNVVGATATSFTITNPTKDVSVTCKVSNSVGNVTSNVAKLTIDTRFNAGDIIIAADTTNFSLSTALINKGWDKSLPVVVTVTVNKNIKVGSKMLTASFNVEALPLGSTVKLINNGYIVGYGGSGGGMTYREGHPGGTALKLLYNVTIYNNGTIGGGGGGGGSLWWGATPGTGASEYDTYYAGGGGGAGYLRGSGGATRPDLNAGLNGGYGTLLKGGRGAATGSGATGSGGDLGKDGFAASGNGRGGAEQGGKAGFSIIGNSYANFVVTGTILGPIK